jgi:hypothetical protein
MYVTGFGTGAVYQGDTRNPGMEVFKPAGSDGRSTATGVEVDQQGRVWVPGWAGDFPTQPGFLNGIVGTPNGQVAALVGGGVEGSGLPGGPTCSGWTCAPARSPRSQSVAASSRPWTAYCLKADGCTPTSTFPTAGAATDMPLTWPSSPPT